MLLSITPASFSVINFIPMATAAVTTTTFQRITTPTTLLHSNHHHRRRLKPSSKISLLQHSSSTRHTQFPFLSSSSHDTIVTDHAFIIHNDDQSQVEDAEEDTTTENDSTESDGTVLEESPASILAYREHLADNNNESKISEINTYLKSVENENLVLENQLSRAKDQAFRISANTDNFRKRTERERISLVANAQGEVVENLLPVLDNGENHRLPILSTRHHPAEAGISAIPQHIIQNQPKYHDDDDDDEKFIRTHNGKSTSLLFQNHPKPNPSNSNNDEIFKLLELSNRTPQFPGSIYAQSSSSDIINSSSLSSLIETEAEEEVIIRALEIRRQVTLEIFIESMMKAKFGITYATNLGSTLFPHYIDHLMIQAASIKHTPEFANSSFNLRVKASLQASNLIPLIRWLKHNGLSYPQIGKLVYNSRGNIESIRTTADWLKSIHVSGRSIGVVLIRAGKIVLDRNTLELDEIIWYLEKNGVKREWMGYVVSRCPEILTFTMDQLKTRINFYYDMGINQNDFGTMVFDFPKVLGFYSIQEMNHKVAYLMEFGLCKEDVGRLLAFRPQLMGCDIEDRWKPLVKYLYYLGISRNGMRRILTVKPMVFCFDLESNIVQKVQFFRDIGVQEKGIASMLVKFPSLLTYSLYKKIRPVVIFLLTKAGVSRTDIGKVIGLGPELLGCSISKKLEPNVKYFLSLGIELKTLGQMIADFPMLLRYNIDILRPKYRYLRRTMVRPLGDLIEFPRFFSYSLEERIIPRHKILMDNRINLKLRYMLSNTDDEFHQRVEAAVQRRQMFESGITNNEDLSSPTHNSSEDENADDFPSTFGD